MRKKLTYNDRYLQILDSTIDKQLIEHPRSFIVRLDLRMDEYIPNSEGNLIARFVNSLKSQLKARESRRRKNGKRVKPSTMRHIWCLERSSSDTDHYHLALFFNKDEFFTLGAYNQVDSLAYMINKAWNSALGYRNDDAPGLVHFPKRGQYWIHENSADYHYERELVFNRLKYLCKNETKTISRQRRSFGSSLR